jgi:hypothetical protein
MPGLQLGLRRIEADGTIVAAKVTSTHSQPHAFPRQLEESWQAHVWRVRRKYEAGHSSERRLTSDPHFKQWVIFH